MYEEKHEVLALFEIKFCNQYSSLTFGNFSMKAEYILIAKNMQCVASNAV